VTRGARFDRIVQIAHETESEYKFDENEKRPHQA
jgi:hypothetical protein